MAAVRLALVTGTSSGIGKATVQQLLAADWAVIGMARRPADFGSPRYFHMGIDLAQLPSMVHQLEREVGGILEDPALRRVGLVNNAALTGRSSVVDRYDAADLLTTYATNVVAPTWLMGLVLRHCRREAKVRIVNVSSGAATHAMPGMGPYSGTKAALRMASMAAAADLESEPMLSRAPTDVAVLSYAPGIVDTEMQAAARSQSPTEFPSTPMFEQWHREGALVPPEAPAAEIVKFLSSESAPRFSEARLGQP
jgi:benzil reductase ((S)-benzoin forming)